MDFKTIFGSVRHAFASANKVQLLWICGILLSILLLLILHHAWRKDWKDSRRKRVVWRLLCYIPIVLCAVHFYFTCWGFPPVYGSFALLYILAAFMLLLMLCSFSKVLYRILAALFLPCFLLIGFYMAGQAPNLTNHSRESYTESFKSMVRDMDKLYVLKEWKEVDFSALEAKYLPAVQEAEQEQDPGKFLTAVHDFASELHDGHVSVDACFDIDEYELRDQTHEYGLSMTLLDSGEVIAVCTVDSVRELGIENGTVITKWNGKPVLQAAEEDTADVGMPVKANADRLNVMNLAGVGGDSAEVSFLDADGEEQTVTLPDLGELHTKPEAFAAFRGLPNSEAGTYEALEARNFEARMLTKTCGYLALTVESTGNDFQDIAGYLAGNHKWARDKFREQLNKLKSQGMETLVIDLRNNRGGLDEIGCALTDLLTDSDWYGQGLGIRKNGQYTCVSDHGVHGTGEFKDLQCIALTNYSCVSAGDGTSLYLSKLPNVTLAGITDPCGCNQETGGVCILSGGLVYVMYPTGLIMNEDGEPNVDTKADRISRNPVEVRIPFDKEAALKMFSGEDYELDWAVQQLENAE